MWGWGASGIGQKVAGSLSAATEARARRSIQLARDRCCRLADSVFCREKLASSRPQLDNSNRPSLIRATGTVVTVGPASRRDALGELSEPLAHVLADRLHFRMTERHLSPQVCPRIASRIVTAYPRRRQRARGRHARNRYDAISVAVVALLPQSISRLAPWL